MSFLPSYSARIAALSELSAGDEITYWLRDRRHFRTIDRVTPTGRIVVGAWTFNSDGSYRGKGRSFTPSRIEPATAEHHAEVEAKKANRAEADEIVSRLGRIEKTFRHVQRYPGNVQPEGEALLEALRAYEAAVDARREEEKAARDARRSS